MIISSIRYTSLVFIRLTPSSTIAMIVRGRRSKGRYHQRKSKPTSLRFRDGLGWEADSSRKGAQVCLERLGRNAHTSLVLNAERTCCSSSLGSVTLPRSAIRCRKSIGGVALGRRRSSSPLAIAVSTDKAFQLPNPPLERVVLPLGLF